MKNEVVDIITKANFDSEFIIFVDENIGEYKKKYNKPYHIDLFTNPLADDDPQVRLYESLYELLDLKRAYLSRDINLSIFYKTIYDLYYRIERYYSKHHTYGLEVSDLYWLGFIFRAESFDIGSLRFQRFKLSYKEIQRDAHERMEFKHKDIFLEGMNIVNIHILNNANLNDNVVEASFELANNFFDKHFSDFNFEYYFCRSWLIYPKLLEIIPEDSNIAKFIKRFEIIAVHNNPTQALNRIYNTSDLEKIKRLEHRTSLQKTAYLNLDKLGVALGIIKR